MHFELIFVLYLLLGVVSGLLGGLLGIGGGVVTVPVLYYMFRLTHTYESGPMQVAIATSLAIGFVISTVSTLSQWKKGAISLGILRWMALSLVIGCVAGAILAHHMQSGILSIIFAIMALLMGTYLCFPKLPSFQIARSPNRSLSFLSLFVGGLSSMIGIGGGSIVFPLLLAYRVRAHEASASASICTWITTGIGSLTYLLIAPSEVIDLSAWAIIGISSAVVVPIGVKWAHTFKTSLIKQILGVSLLIIGLGMVGEKIFS